MLLTSLEGEAIRGVALRIQGDTHESAGNLPLKPLRDRHVASVRATKPERNAKALGVTHRNIRAELAGRGKEREREQIRGHDCLRLVGLNRGNHVARIPHATRSARVLHKRAEVLARRSAIVREIDVLQFNANGLGTAAENSAGRRQHVGVHEEHIRLVAAGRAARKKHCLGSRSGLIEHRRVCDLEAREVPDHGLIVEQCLESTLRDLRLVRRVRRIPSWVLEDVSLNDRGRVRAVVPVADERSLHGVFLRKSAKLLESLGFARAFGKQGIQPLVEKDRARHGFFKKCTERVEAKRLEHSLLVLARSADMTTNERMKTVDRRIIDSDVAVVFRHERETPQMFTCWSVRCIPRPRADHRGCR